jgi:hypothetical protein
MSPEAQKLIELTEDSHGNLKEGVSMTQVIKDHPELVTGLDEYMKHREDHGRMVAESGTKKEIGHSMKRKPRR